MSGTERSGSWPQVWERWVREEKIWNLNNLDIHEYIWLIVESIDAGLIISLINKYIISKDVIENCMAVQQEEEYTEMVSVSTSISDWSG